MEARRSPGAAAGLFPFPPRGLGRFGAGRFVGVGRFFGAGFGGTGRFFDEEDDETDVFDSNASISSSVNPDAPIFCLTAPIGKCI